MPDSEEQIRQYHDADDARERIEERPLSIEVRGDWHTLGEPSEDAEYKVLLTTGGPALRIIGELDESHTPSTAHLEYQDWGIPWMEFNLDEDAADADDSPQAVALLYWVQQLYFGE